MRSLWVWSRHASAKVAIENALGHGQDIFVIREGDRTHRPTDSELRSHAVIYVVDALYSDVPGFELVRQLRQWGAVGTIVFVGSPPLGDLRNEMTHHGIDFWVSDRGVDGEDVGELVWDWVAATIRAATSYDGKQPLAEFVLRGGHSSSEQIRTLDQFQNFSARILHFAKSLGLDQEYVKRTLRAMTSIHFEKTRSGVSLLGEFPIFFGVDREKLLLGVRLLSKGVTESDLRQEFLKGTACQDEGHVPSMSFPEYGYLFRETRSMISLGGNFRLEGSDLDPVSLLTFIPLQSRAVPQVLGCYRAAKFAKVDLSADGPSHSPEAPVSIVSSQSVEVPTIAISAEQSAQLLAPPSDPSAVSADVSPEAPSTDHGAIKESHEISSTDLSELQELRVLNAALSRDVARLMKERKVASTQVELKAELKRVGDQNAELRKALDVLQGSKKSA